MNADLAPTLPGEMSLSRRSVATTCIVGLLGGSALLGPHASAERLPNMGNPLAPSLALAQVAPGLPAGPNPAGPGPNSTAPGPNPPRLVQSREFAPQIIVSFDFCHRLR